MKGIQALFDWVVLSSSITGLMVLVILAVKQIFKDRLSAAWHYYIWFLLLVRLIIPYAPENPYSICNLLTPSVANTVLNIHPDSDYTGNDLFGRIVSVEDQAATQASSRQQNQTAAKGMGQSVFAVFEDMYKNWSMKSILFLIWLAGVFLIAFYIIFVNLRLWHGISSSPKLHNEQVNRILKECRSTMRIRRSIPVVLSPVIGTPSLYGIFRPKLLLPVGILRKVSETDLKYILLHELVHLKRKDVAIHWLVVLLKILHWFNPLLWYGFYRMHQDGEVSCDALVLSSVKPEERIEYGYTIIRLLKIAQPRSIPGTTGMMTGKFQMKRRITMISKFKKITYKWTTVGITIILVMTFFMLTNAKSSPVKVSATYQPGSGTNLDKGDRKTAAGNITELAIEGKGFNGKMLIIPDPRKIAVGYDLKVSRTTSGIAKDSKAIAAINAGGFGSDQSEASEYKPYGAIIHEGRVICNGLKDDNASQDIVGFTDTGTLVVGKHTLAQLKKYGVKEAVCFGPALIVNGKSVITEGDGGWGIAPRTAIGQREDGTVLFLVINGRSVKSLGATLLDIQDILMKQGAVNASNLDGGSSSTMYFNGKVINHPSDLGGERSVPSIFMVMP